MKFHTLRFLADENISPKIVSFLRSRDCDVLDIKEEGWHGMEDQDILEAAFKNQRFVLTHDSDFGTLAVNEGRGCFGIIYLRLRDLKAKHILAVFEKLLALEIEIDIGTIVVVHESGIRIRHIGVEEPE